MSRVYFHSPSGEAELWGGERAWLGLLVSDIALGFIGVHDCDRMRQLIKPGDELLNERYYPRQSEQITWTDRLKMSLRVGDGDGTLAWNGKPISSFSLLLNTACAVGSDAVKLAARIHGQCELHCYVEGTDRAWLAGIIGQGLESGVFRRKTRYPDRSEDWECVTAFLLARDDEPVVLSYSACEQFPNPYEAGWTPPAGEDIYDSWSDLPQQDQWGIAMTALRRQGGGLRMDPAKWAGFKFGHELSMLDLLAADWQERLERTLTS